MGTARPPASDARATRRAPRPSGTLGEALRADHARLDALFIRVMRALRAGRPEEAVPSARALIEGLRRHIRVENEILAPRLEVGLDVLGEDPVRIMIREHDEILRILRILEEELNRAAPERNEFEIWLNLLAGTLAKHEYREETLLFPAWDVLLARRGDAARLIERVKAALHEPEPAATHR